MRIVCDPNVLISALISSDGPPRAVVEAWKDGSLELVTCPYLFEELENVLRRPKITGLVSENLIEPYLRGLLAGTTLLDDPVEPRRTSVDPDDDYLVALAVSSGADFLVSGDRHLTDISELVPTVLTPRQFVDLHL